MTNQIGASRAANLGRSPIHNNECTTIALAFREKQAWH
jgi:hypothetical protein